MGRLWKVMLQKSVENHGLILGVIVLLLLLLYGACSVFRDVTGVRTYNESDAKLVNKVREAVEKGIPPADIEQFVGVEATVNTWRSEPRYGLSDVSIGGDPELILFFIPKPSPRIYAATNVMMWPRPVKLEDHCPRMVGILWEKDGSVTVFGGIGYGSD